MVTRRESGRTRREQVSSALGKAARALAGPVEGAVKSEIQLACEIVRLLDGIPIESAQHALTRAQALLLKTQIIRADSALLAVADQNDATFNR